MISDKHWRKSPLILIFAALSLCGGCATPANHYDPLEKINRFFYGFNDTLDHYALKPAADVYRAVVPKPIREGIGNGFDNLTYFSVVVSDVLEGKKDQAFGDGWRFVINSTFGIGGIFDIATPTGLPAHNNDFGVVLGKWGVGPGPYLMVPLGGPYTLRDLAGPGGKALANPLTWLYFPWRVTFGLSVIDPIQTRSRDDFIFKFRNAAAVDPYVFTREAYMQYRQGLIDEGRPTTRPSQQNVYDEDLDSSEPSTKPSTQPSSQPDP
jgi:phospholipid-binding lipoprotein MlaA